MNNKECHPLLIKTLGEVIFDSGSYTPPVDLTRVANMPPKPVVKPNFPRELEEAQKRATK